MASFAEFTGGRSNEDDTSSILDSIGRRAQSFEILSTKQERAGEIHSKCVAPLVKTHVDDRRIVGWPDSVVDDEDAHGTAVLVGGIVQQVLDATFVADVGLDGDDVLERCELSDVAVVMCCYSGSELAEGVDCLETDASRRSSHQDMDIFEAEIDGHDT